MTLGFACTMLTKSVILSFLVLQLAEPIASNNGLASSAACGASSRLPFKLLTNTFRSIHNYRNRIDRWELLITSLHTSVYQYVCQKT